MSGNMALSCHLSNFYKKSVEKLPSNRIQDRNQILNSDSSIFLSNVSPQENLKYKI
ncbi:hypothetical protein LEP1GSC103_1984 [Leptospira borgpetersenii serovar Javanica str. UI 09931]|uniref:Uncharacterized protein n=4 Tax=Leptospira borgpetersenii TaxID=174 RepID=M3GIL7_LEPBO|nr:hypothetical protein LEP1GSC128_0849 [Leptospira borgpetersenii str. 200801926]EKQ91701.1 hypothetical protein LEP1GSC101_0743 [Leptospira borgpetersenii str. UI 09149]EKQ99328.1 hypothetical protein LEP1GSC121_2441 [Leptospira borgpetersenii serovar Castellonis str. 200801910]EMG00812.1 hypothetical protein LEP1GSC123_0518 [Leptospira borgpetersenii str. 200701203]EMK08665.1 hypothetical protein LEP1GSC066_0139 [Leptospira sp. serovar Kenya str. Sh9]EMN59840.1 hypothetical protein LEP1GSC0